jgi:energy coupling factor transporter S component ThiW
MHTRRLVLAALFAAMGYVLSLIPGIPVGPTRVQPFQHTLNAIAGVLVGPWYASAAALVTAYIRLERGTGTLFAFPGSLPGALLVGLVYVYVWRRTEAAFVEPIGTGIIGALLSWLIVAPMVGSTRGLSFFIVAFLASSIPGCIIGYLVLKALHRAGVTTRAVPESV